MSHCIVIRSDTLLEDDMPSLTYIGSCLNNWLSNIFYFLWSNSRGWNIFKCFSNFWSCAFLALTPFKRNTYFENTHPRQQTFHLLMVKNNILLPRILTKKQILDLRWGFHIILTILRDSPRCFVVHISYDVLSIDLYVTRSSVNAVVSRVYP